MQPGQDGLIVVLGHENDDNGLLSDSARRRCAAAAAVAKKRPTWWLITTGGFGPGFNTSDRAHGTLLRDELLSMSIDAARILPHANSANTVEDAFFVRKMALDQEFERMIVVTSDYHMPRAKYVFRRVSPEMEIEFCACDDALMPSLIRGETEKLNWLKAEWVEVPSYTKGAEFPIEQYKAASEEQKHYDTIGNLIITSMFGVFGFPYIVTVRDSRLLGALLLLSAALVLMLLALYLRTASFARIARRVMHYLEASYASPNFTINYKRQMLRKQAAFLAMPTFSRAWLSRLDYATFAIIVAVSIFAMQFLLGISEWVHLTKLASD